MSGLPPIVVAVWLSVSGQPAPVCHAATDVPRLGPGSALPDASLALARCVGADIEAGRWADAGLRVVKAQRAGIALAGAARREWDAQVARLDATRRVDAGNWSALVDEVIAHEDALPWVGLLVRGVAAARSSWATQDAALLARARDALRQLEVLAAQAGPLSEEERARLLVQGAMAGAQYERDEMQLLLDAAHDLEVRLLAGDERRGPVVIAWELQADLLRMTDRYAAASERYRDVLRERPRRVQSRIGLAEAYRRLGYAHEADETLAQARALWSAADPEARALLR